jgi:hypothetical protein
MDPTGQSDKYKQGVWAAGHDYPVMHATKCPFPDESTDAAEWINGYCEMFDWCASQLDCDSA